jgi:Multicopper oxidase
VVPPEGTFPPSNISQPVLHFPSFTNSLYLAQTFVTMSGRLFARALDAVLSLTGTLPQSYTNGASWWGTSSAPTLCSHLGDECPWGDRTVANSHPQYDMPDTGVTRYYDLTIARQTLAPDGVTQSLITVNGQFPGPLIEANWGDWYVAPHELHRHVANNCPGSKSLW